MYTTISHKQARGEQGMEKEAIPGFFFMPAGPGSLVSWWRSA